MASQSRTAQTSHWGLPSRERKEPLVPLERKEIKGRKVVVESTVLANGVATARGEVVALQMPDSFGA